MPQTNVMEIQEYRAEMGQTEGDCPGTILGH